MLAEGEWRIVEAGRKMVGRWWRRKRKKTPAAVVNDADENEEEEHLKWPVKSCWSDFLCNCRHSRKNSSWRSRGSDELLWSLVLPP